MSLDTRFIIRETNRRLAGQMSDAEWAEFQSMLTVAEAGYALAACQCDGKGWLTVKDEKGYRSVCACTCEIGKNLPPFFSPSDKEKERPLKLPAISQVRRPNATERAAESPRGRERAFKD
jgi:hypothetical protein